MTLGNAATAKVRFLVWCLDCRYRAEPDPAEMAQQYGAEMTVNNWHKRLSAVSAARGTSTWSLPAPSADKANRRCQLETSKNLAILEGS